MADSENPSQANPSGGIGAEAVGWVKALAVPLAGGGVEGAHKPHSPPLNTPPPDPPPPPGSSGGRWRWEPDPVHAAEQHAAPRGDGIAMHAAAPSGGSRARSSGGFLDFFGGAGSTAPDAPAAHEPGRGIRSCSAAAAVQSSARLSTRPRGFEGRDAHKRFAMPCITLREDTRGNVTLFGMEPGGALEALGTVRSGDIIVQVDGKPALGRTEKQVRGLLVGEKGSVCTIHWVPPDKVTGIDAAERSQITKHLVVTELVRDIPVAAGGGNLDFTGSVWELGQSQRSHASSADSGRISWNVSRTSARSTVGEVSTDNERAAAGPSGLWPWNGGAWGTGAAASERMDLPPHMHVSSSSYAAASGRSSGGVTPVLQGSERSRYSSRMAHSERSAVEEYEDEIQPEVVRRQWVALGGIFLLLIFIWLWALNGGPLAALWAHK